MHSHTLKYCKGLFSHRVINRGSLLWEKQCIKTHEEEMLRNDVYHGALRLGSQRLSEIWKSSKNKEVTSI